MARGGARPGAGRKRKGDLAKAEVHLGEPGKLYKDALQFLMSVINDPEAPPTIRMQAAQVAVPYTNSKMADAKIGKKDVQQEAAKAAVTGQFGTRSSRRPSLAVDNG